MIDTKADPSLTNIDDAKMRLTDPARGLVVGNGVRFDVTLLSVARHAAPEPGIIYHYDNFYTAERPALHHREIHAGHVPSASCRPT